MVRSGMIRPLMAENPVVVFGSRKEFGAVYIHHLLDIYGAFAYHARPYRLPFMKEDGYVGIYILDMNYGEVEGVDVFGEPLNQSYGANDLAVGVAYSSVLEERWYYGVGLKFAYSGIAGYSSTGIFADFSVRYDPPQIDQFSIYLLVRNTGFFTSSYTEAPQRIPFLLEAGIRKKLEHLPLHFSLALSDISGSGVNNGIFDKWKAGMEIQLHQNVRIRGGYNRLLNRSMNSAGVGSFAGVSLGGRSGNPLF